MHLGHCVEAAAAAADWIRIFITSKGVTKAEVINAPEQDAIICCVGVIGAEVDMLKDE